MKQQTLAMAADAQLGFEQHRKPTRRDEFLKTMDSLVPWAALCESPRFLWRLNTLRGLSHEEDEQVLARGP